MKEELLTIIFIIGWVIYKYVLVPKLSKNKEDIKQKNSPNPAIESELIFEENDEAIGASEMRNVEPNIPKEPEYFTYETTDLESERRENNRTNKDKENIQVVENEQENNVILTFEEEEIYKGFIYSEIFRKHVN